MSSHELLLRAGSVVLASLAGWTAAAFWLWALRVRDASLRSACWTLALLPPVLVALGLGGGGFLRITVDVPPDRMTWVPPWTTPAVIGGWALVCLLLVAARMRRDARLVACLDGVAASQAAPDDVADAVARAARWVGVRAPRIACAEADGTAFVAGVCEPVLFVPLALWRRLDAPGRRAMLLHELSHVLRKDPLRLRVISYLADVLWPAVWVRWSARRLAEAWEARADEEALRSGAERGALARSLVLVAAPRAPSCVLAFGCSGKAARRRLGSLLRPRLAALVVQTVMLAALFPWSPEMGNRAPLRLTGDPGRDAIGSLRIAVSWGNVIGHFLPARVRDEIRRTSQQEQSGSNSDGGSR